MIETEKELGIREYSPDVDLDFMCEEIFGGTDLEKSEYRVVKFSPDNECDDMDLFLFAYLELNLGNLCRKEEYGHCIVDKRTGEFILLTGIINEAELNEAIKKIKALASTGIPLHNRTISCGVSNVFEELTQMQSAYSQAEMALKQRDVEEATVYFSSIDESRCKNRQYIMNKVLEYIERNFTGQITLEGVARYVYVNPAYLSSIFKKHTGENFMSYLTARRIRYAKELLENPKYKIYEIGRMVGYLDPGYFSIIFKKNEGITPYEYRSKML